MSKITTFILSAAFAVTAAFSAGATTLASFAVTGGTWAVVAGDTITITGAYAGDATAFLALDQDEALPLFFGASLDVDGNNVFDEELGPIVASPEDVVSAGSFILDTLIGSIADSGLVNVDLSGTGGLTGPGTLAGTFTAVLTSNIQFISLSQMINVGLEELGLLGTLLPQSFMFPTDAEGTYEAELTIGTVAAVPLPAGLPLLGAGLLGLVALRRRRPAHA